MCVEQGYLEVLKGKDLADEKTRDSVKKENEIDIELVKKLKKGQEILVNNFETKESETNAGADGASSTGFFFDGINAGRQEGGMIHGWRS